MHSWSTGAVCEREKSDARLPPITPQNFEGDENVRPNNGCGGAGRNMAFPSYTVLQMYIYKGIIQIRYDERGFSSEGTAAYLVLDDGTELRLYRPDVYELDDACFEPFDGLTVEIVGRREPGDYLSVEDVKVASADEYDLDSAVLGNNQEQ